MWPIFLFFTYYKKIHLPGAGWDTCIKKFFSQTKKISFAWTRLGHFYKKTIKKLTIIKKITTIRKVMKIKKKKIVITCSHYFYLWESFLLRIIIRINITVNIRIIIKIDFDSSSVSDSESDSSSVLINVDICIFFILYLHSST